MSDLPHRDLHEANRQSWNAATLAHNSHKRDQAGFLRGGGSTLFPEEIALLGDVAGRRLLHLQCNAGQDTLSLAQRGAVVTGVDISDEAIRFATQLAADSGLPGTFYRADVYDWLAAARQRPERFDVVFTSYGGICWLSDLTRWARGVADLLTDGGRLVLVEFHPAAMMFDNDFRLAYSYFGSDRPLKWDDGVSDYVGLSGGALSPSGFEAGVGAFRNAHPAYEFQWTIGALLTAVLGAGLRIDQFCEYPYFNGAKLYNEMREMPGRRMVLPEGTPSIPMMYGLVASRPGRSASHKRLPS